MTRDSASKTSEEQIHVVGLSKHYGDFRALDDVSLDVPLGEFLTLLGPSGSGKSTLLMAIAGFVTPTAGDVRIGDRSIVALPPEKRNFGVVFQGYALFPHMTVAANLAYPLQVRGASRSTIEAKVKETLDLVQLDTLADRLPKQLSGGQQQRVALARALIFSPEILLLDEPLGALDKKLRQDLQSELRELHSRLGKTFINVTHDQEEAMAMSDRIAIMNAGKIVQVGVPDLLYSAPRTRFVADFLGKSNFFTGSVQSVDDQIATIDTKFGRIRHVVGCRPVHSGAEVLLALRPEKINFRPGENTISAKVEASVFLGKHAEIVLRTGTSAQRLTACIAGEDIVDCPRQGDDVQVSWSPNSSVIVAQD